MSSNTGNPPEDSGKKPQLIRAIPVPHYGRWAAAALLALLAAMVIHSLATNKNFHWDMVWKTLFTVEIFRAIGWTLILTITAMAIGIALAILMAIMRRSDNPVMRSVATFYIWFFRGTPIYTQLIFWGLIGVLYPRLSLGVPFGPEFFSFRTYDLFTAAVAAIVGLGLNEGAYLAEIVRSGLNSVDKGQEEAAQALGMNPRQILYRIIIPQAMRVIVPPTGNETISMLKTTSLVTAVPFTFELTKVAADYGSQTFHSSSSRPSGTWPSRLCSWSARRAWKPTTAKDRKIRLPARRGGGGASGTIRVRPPSTPPTRRPKPI